MSITKKKKQYNFFNILIKTIGIFVKVNPRYFCIFLLMNIIAGLIQPFLLIIQQNIFEQAYQYSLNNISIHIFIIFVITYILLKIVIHYLDGFDDLLVSYAYVDCEAAMTKNLNSKLANIALDKFEDVELYKNILKARNAIDTTTKTQFYIMSGIIYQIFTLAGYFSYLLVLNPQLLIIVALICIPIILSFILKGKHYYKLQNANIINLRKMKYFSSCMNGKEYLKETRILGALGYFANLFKESIIELNKNEKKTSKRIFNIDVTLAIFSFFSIGSCFILAAYYLFTQQISVGAFASVLVAIDDLYFYIYGTFYIIGNAIKSAPQSRNYFEFIDNIDNKIGNDNKITLNKEIELKNVSYSYPSSNIPVINNINLKIKRGEKIAIVGVNGAGKTTLVKLICGLYRGSGEVLYDGIPINGVNKRNVYSNISAVFQDFGKYKLTLKENVAISDCKNIDDDKKFNEAIINSQFEEEFIIENQDRIIGNEFGGIELSGGQWQKLAIARGFFRKYELIVLDEPTSAIDPILENDLYKKFKNIMQNKTGIIVTHRLGSAKIADRILVLDKGRIIEDGTHEELMANNGLYTEMYKSQAAWYNR
ncbi:ABC transporter ATP-binding protein [Anaerocolumna chitinilytica]|uniref:ABC transporter ATP-binding protein n=1 Tax=Anaerocolumna chitinilytica TaxID=1727145 RepID=A0A7M3SA68_9FIRM|nr:ABC transporter ATP-binding protein [Anaerocolumna chitinilytica]BCK01486.1 ABC transporter ATP-binding protein [Anaerocolumna chitinilytica]